MPNDPLAPVLYLPHGGGPLPLLGDPGHANMIDFLTRITPTLGRPSAILVISAHWEEPRPTITSGANPSVIYDYSGFPEESYHITYPAPGDPALAERVYGLLREAGIDAHLDAQRGFDHGLYVPLKIMYPDAKVPCIQLSLIRGLDAGAHLQLGRALTKVRQENLLIIGSGFSFHNMRAFDFAGRETRDDRNDMFQDWLIETCTRADLSHDEREARLAAWDDAPAARYCHPREEHLMPLHVCCGLAGTPAKVVFDGYVIGKRAVGLLW